jgi:hypothetical protein
LFAVSERDRPNQIYIPNANFSSFTTDDRGIYRLYGISPGRYIVAVGTDPELGGGRITSANISTPLTYHPDATEHTKATVIEVSAGSEATGIDIVTGRASKAYSASGRIIDADTGRPVVAIQLGISSMKEGRAVFSTSSSGSTSGARGEFRIDGLAPGQYAAYAVPAPESEMASDSAAFTVGESDVTGLEIKIRRGSTIIGNVVIEGAEGHPEAPRLSDIRVAVSSRSLNVAARSEMLRIAPDGSFRAAGLPRGVANFVVFTYPPNKNLTLVRVERGGVEQKSGIEIGQGEEIAGVTVVFAYGTGTIRGQVQIVGGELPPDAFMLLHLQRTGNSQYHGRSPMPDSRGRFEIGGLLAGDYELSLNVLVKAGAGARTITAVNQKVTVTDGVETAVTITVDMSNKKQ